MGVTYVSDRNYWGEVRSKLAAIPGRFRLILSITGAALVWITVFGLPSRSHLSSSQNKSVTAASQAVPDDYTWNALKTALREGKYVEPPKPAVAPKVKPIVSVGGNWHKFEYMFAFGDSWSMTGFDENGAPPSLQNPMGNPELPQNGVNSPPEWLYFMTAKYNESFIRTYNMAHGAATIDRDVVPPHSAFDFTHTFKEQVENIFHYHYAPAPTAWKKDNTLFAIWFGVVDTALLLEREQYRDDVRKGNFDVNINIIKAYRAIVDQLYAEGARQFLLLNIPPLHLAPDVEYPAIVDASVTDFNKRLSAMREALTAAHKDANVRMFDVHSLLNDIIEKPDIMPQTAQLRNTTKNCWNYNPDAFDTSIAWDRFDPECGVPFDQYFWSNPLHVTHPVHSATAAAIVRDCMGKAKISFPFGFCS